MPSSSLVELEVEVEAEVRVEVEFATKMQFRFNLEFEDEVFSSLLSRAVGWMVWKS